MTSEEPRPDDQGEPLPERGPWGPPPGWGPPSSIDPARLPPGWGISPWGDPLPIPDDEFGFPITGPGSRPPIGPRAIARIIDMVPMFAVFTLAALQWVEIGSDNSVDVSKVPLWLFPAVQFFDIAYQTIAVAVWGRTIGKWIMGLRVEDPYGAKPGWWRAAVRVLIPDVAAMIPLIGGTLMSAAVYLTAIWSPLRQGLHDRAAGTIVVRSR